MKTKMAIIFGLVFVFACQRGPYVLKYSAIGVDSLTVFPNTQVSKPDQPSPLVDENEREYVLAIFSDSLYAWLDVTVENGEEFDYKRSLYGKGLQLQADSIDFPHLAKYGIHSDRDLGKTLSITGRSVSQITVDGRPLASSGVGFMRDDETVMSVIRGDNDIVRRLGLTHPEIARPLFHLWNTSWKLGRVESDLVLKGIYYNDKYIEYDFQGSRGWQESIFNDEILGSGHINITSTLREEDIEFLKNQYKKLEDKNLDSLLYMLSHIHTGEMVLYYINRYGFYEGRNEYKPDPLVVAYLFGLKTIDEIHSAAEGDLFKHLTTPYTENPRFKGSRLRAQGSSKDEGVKLEGQVADSRPQVMVNAGPGVIDSLVMALASAGRNWNEPSGELIKIGEDAVPALLKLLLDRNADEWPRRTAARTLNRIGSPKTVEPGIKLLLDASDNINVRNQIVSSLTGYDLSEYRNELWEMFNSLDDQWVKSNIANLLKTADTSYAYNAFRHLYYATDGFVQRHSLANLAELRPVEATHWYLDGLQKDDWVVGNLCMDSLVKLDKIESGLLMEMFGKDDTSEQTRWRIVHVLGQLEDPGLKTFIEKVSGDESWLIRMEALYHLSR